MIPMTKAIGVYLQASSRGGSDGQDGPSMENLTLGVKPRVLASRQTSAGGEMFSFPLASPPEGLAGGFSGLCVVAAEVRFFSWLRDFRASGWVGGRAAASAISPVTLFHAPYEGAKEALRKAD